MTTTSPSLEGRVALVTGGSRGLGRGIVEALAGRGARVVALARDGARLSALAEQVQGVIPIAADAANEAEAERLLRAHDPDLLVLCAGAEPHLGPFYEQTWEQFSTNWQVDTKGAFVWLKHALRMPMKPGGHIIVISSGAAVQGSPVSGGYAGAKRGQWLLAEYAATESERGQRGLRVHCLLPFLNASTELGRAGIAAYAERAGVTPEQFAKRFSPPLTPEIMGTWVAELAGSPERFDQRVYRIGGGGLTPLT